MNTIKIYQVLQARGFSAEEASTFIEGMAENQDVATKADILDLKSDIKDLKAEMKTDMSQLENKLLREINTQTKWFIGSVAVIAGVVGTILKVADMYIQHKG